MNKWTFLSHQLSPNHFAYGNRNSIQIKYSNKIDKGNSSNNTILNLPTHFGTHLDFPYHFDNKGKTIQEYSPDYFISNKVQYIELNVLHIENYMITINDFSDFKFIKNTEILILKTGMSNFIKQNEYWNANPGFAPELASHFNNLMPNLRIFGFDSISLTGRKFRKEGKAAHLAFLIEQNILVLEDMDLSELLPNSFIQEIFISPLRFDNADGAPVSVFAKVNC